MKMSTENFLRKIIYIKLGIYKQAVNFHDADLTRQQIATIARTLKENDDTKTLDLSGNDIRIPEFLSLFASLGENHALEYLYLVNINLNFFGANILSRGLTINTSLIKLDLRGNNIGMTGAEYLSEALSTNHTLKILDLSENNLKAIGALHISTALKSNHTLEELLLEHNKICVGGIFSLSKALEVNDTLKILSLKGNNIDSTGAGYLIKALYHNRGLENIDLKSNHHIPLELRQQINSLLETETRIQTTKFLQKNIKPNSELPPSFKLNDSGYLGSPETERHITGELTIENSPE